MLNRWFQFNFFGLAHLKLTMLNNHLLLCDTITHSLGLLITEVKSYPTMCLA